MERILNDNYVQTPEKDIALIMLPFTVCNPSNYVNEEISRISGFFSCNINKSLVVDELKIFAKASNIYRSPKNKIITDNKLFFESCYYKNDNDSNKLLKCLVLGITYLNETQGELVSETPIFKRISKILNQTNSTLNVPVGNANDLKAYADGCNPFSYWKKNKNIIEYRNFVDDLYTKMFALNSENIRLYNLNIKNKNSSKNEINEINENDKLSIKNDLNFTDFSNLRIMIAESIYGVIIDKDADNILIHRFSHMFKKHLIDTRLFSNNSLSAISNTPIIEIMNELKSITLRYVSTIENSSNNFLKKDSIILQAYEQKGPSMHLDFFQKLIFGIINNNKNNKKYNDIDNEENVKIKMKTYSDLFIKLGIPLLKGNLDDHLFETSLITTTMIKLTYNNIPINKNKLNTQI